MTDGDEIRSPHKAYHKVIDECPAALTETVEEGGDITDLATDPSESQLVGPSHSSENSVLDRRRQTQHRMPSMPEEQDQISDTSCILACGEESESFIAEKRPSASVHSSSRTQGEPIAGHRED